jgi:hypothetical protein
MTTLYVIDGTSRQHSFDITKKGIKFTMDGIEQTITKDNINLELFFDAITNKKPFILQGESGGVVYNTNAIIGVQVVKPQLSQPEEETIKAIE